MEVSFPETARGTADDAAEADRRLKATIARYHKTAPGLPAWLEKNIPEALTVFGFPAAHLRRLRTNNGLERLNKGDQTPYPCRHPVPQRGFAAQARLSSP